MTIFTVDTNIFVYSVDQRDPVKRDCARAVLERLYDLDARIGLQVVGEVQNAVHRRLKRTAREGHAVATSILTRFPTFAYDSTDVAFALKAMLTPAATYWDALLLSASRRAGCDVILTEDLQDGRDFNGVVVVKPFDADGEMTPRCRQLLGL